MKLNEQDLARLVKSQKGRIQDVIAERDEAREAARNLLRLLRNQSDVPAVHPSFHWLEETQPPICEQRDRETGRMEYEE